METFYITSQTSSTRLNTTLLFGHPLSAEDDGVYFSYGYIKHRRPWWKPWGSGWFEIHVDATHNGVVLRHWSNTNPAVVECYFEDTYLFKLDASDEKWLTDYFLDCAENAYYYGMR